MNLKIVTCALFILVIIALISYMSIPEQFTNDYKKKIIKENFVVPNKSKNKTFIETFDGHNNKPSNNTTMRDSEMANEISNAIRNQEIIGQEQLSSNEIKKEKESVNVKDVLSTSKLNEPEDLIKNSESLNNMFKKLKDSEQLCTDLQYRQDKRDEIEENRILRKSQIQINEQAKRINELKNIVLHLRKEQLRNDAINKKCQSNNQKLINTDYNMVKKLSGAGLLKDKSVNVNINVSDELKKLKGLNLNSIIGNHARQNSNIRPPPSTQQNVDSLPSNVVRDAEGNLVNKDTNKVAKSLSSIYVTPTSLPPITKDEINKNYDKCNVDKKKYIDIHELQNGVCHGCSPDTLKKNAEKINNDFK